MSVQQPEADRAWAIELHGIDPIKDEERHGSPFELFWIWFAGNIGILGVVYGGILAGAGLNLWQSIFVALVASAVSFALVGALLGLFNLVGLPSNALWTVVSLVIVAALVVFFGLLGHATLVWIQRAATWLFGLLTLVLVVFLISQTQWTKIFAAPPGPWDSGVLAALSIVAAGTGIGWVNAGADYTRYLPRNSSSRSVVGWTVFGGTLPLFVLMIVGVLLSSRVSNLASAANPIAVIGSALPTWMAVPYLITAVGGLVVAADLDIYSSGLNLLSIGVRLERYKTVLIDGVLMIIGAVYVMLIAQNFLGPFESFLQLLADGLTAWSAVFLVDMLRRRRYDPVALADTGSGSHYFYLGGFNWAGMVSWLAGLLAGLAFTSSPFFNGPFARGIFASSSLGFLIGFIVSAVLYAVLMPFASAEKPRAIE